MDAVVTVIVRADRGSAELFMFKSRSKSIRPDSSSYMHMKKGASRFLL